MKLDKESMAFIGIAAALMLAFFFYILGASGLMSALGIILIFILPTYSILNNFNLDNDEKIVFSFFIGVGIFPSIAYWLGTLISFKISILWHIVQLPSSWKMRSIYRIFVEKKPCL